MTKIYKKGQKIKLGCCTHDMGSDETEIITLEDDYTEEELEKMAEEFMWNNKEPEWWFEEVENG